MRQLTEKQKKRLEKLAKVLDGGSIAIVQQIAEVEDKLEEVASQIPEFRQAVDGEKGEQGIQGEKGAPGADGRPGRDGVDGKDGRDGKDGKDGKDGVIDDATIGYIEDKILKLNKEFNTIKSRFTRDNIGVVVRGLIAGTNVTIDNTNLEYPIISATGGGGGATITKGVAEVNFGAITQESDIATVTVSNATITATSYPTVALYAVANADHDPDDYMVESLSAYVTNVVAGVGFDISVRAPQLTWGRYSVTYQF